MSYTNSTTHYGFPLPLGSDLTVPMDYNQAMNDIDDHLFDAESDASTAATAAAAAVETANDAAEEVGTLGTTVNAHGERLTSLEQHDIIQDNKINALETATDTKFDSVGIADAYVEGLPYAVGDIVTYNGQRFKCITAVTAAEPFDSDKWQGEDVQTVLDNINSDLSDIGVYRQQIANLSSMPTSDTNVSIDNLYDYREIVFEPKFDGYVVPHTLQTALVRGYEGTAKYEFPMYQDGTYHATLLVKAITQTSITVQMPNSLFAGWTFESLVIYGLK